MKRQHRIYKKQEKRIVKLLYRKGFINPKRLKDIYWGEGYRNDPPEIMTGYMDSYVCEWSETSLVQEFLFDFRILDELDEYGCPKFIDIHPTRKAFIKRIKLLPTICNDSKINRCLVARLDY